MKATKKIVGAACALVAAVALSAGSTFAWFTSNAEVNIGQIDAKVVTKGGDLQIGLVTYTGDALAPTSESDTGTVKAYKNTIAAADITSKLPEGFKLDAVTTKDSDGKTMQDSEGTAVTANTTYIQFTVSLRSTTNMNIYLAKDASLTSTASANGTNLFAWGTIAENTYGKNQAAWTTESNITEKAKAQAASRVSFETTGTTSEVKVWAPWESKEHGGVLEETAIDALTTGVEEYGYYKGNLASDYAVAGGKDSLKVDAYPSYTKTIAPATGKVVAGTPGTGEVSETDAAGSKLLELKAGVASTVTIRLWVEGKDGDCLNSIFDHQISMALAFVGVDIVPATPTV